MERTPINFPISDDERGKIREQQRDFEREQFMLANKIYAEQTHEYRMRAFEYLKDYGVLTIRTLFILNGAAILGLLTFIASFFTKNDQTVVLIGISLAHQLIVSFYFFVGGLICAAIVSGIGYLNYNSFHEMYDSPVNLFKFVMAKDKNIIDDRHARNVILTARAGMAFAGLGLLCFATGAVVAARSFSSLGVQ